MPEGDTIHRSANRLRPALAGRAVVRVETPRSRVRGPASGTIVEAVEARGKHLLVRFADGSVLRTHMRMSGSWHLYRTGERWRRPPHLMRALVEVEGWVAVCFSAPVVAWERGPLGEPSTGVPDHLGPDLCDHEIDLDGALDAALDAALVRMARYAGPSDEIKPVLLDQRVACGVGNVYASEVLFACAVNPFTPLGALDEASRLRLLGTASRLLRANLDRGPRATVAEGLAVYGRRGRPCRRCGTAVRMRRQGEQARSTYWCPTCQAAPGPGAKMAP